MRSTQTESILKDQPMSFEWTHNGKPEPGLRRWHREDDAWIELYPSGKGFKFRNLCTAIMDTGVTGVVITKKDGYEIFIPDITSENEQLLRARHPSERWCIFGKNPGDDQEQHMIDVMQNIVTNQYAKKKVQSESRELTKIPVEKRAQPAQRTSRLDKFFTVLDRVLPVVETAAKVSEQKKLRKTQEAQQAYERKLAEQRLAIEAQEKAEAHKKEDKKATLNEIDENINQYTQFLKHFNLTKYTDYMDFKSRVYEVEAYAITDGIKSALFNQHRQSQIVELLAVNPTFFRDSRRVTSEADSFKVLLERFRIFSDVQYEDFKKSLSYKQSPLDDLEKEMLFKAHQENLGIDRSASDLAKRSLIDDIDPEERLPELR